LAVAKCNSKTHLLENPFFQSFRPRPHSKFVRSANMKKKIKNATWVKKNAEFDSDFESVAKLQNIPGKKSYQQKGDRKMEFLTFITEF
jgi:hypothetical protein